jgi:ABC-type cobalamin transport system permease subunit
MCAYAVLWLVEYDRLVTLAAYLIAGLAVGVALGVIAAIVDTLAHLIATHGFDFELGYLLLGAMGGVFAAFVRRYHTLTNY